jgi:hypothetical protein
MSQDDRIFAFLIFAILGVVHYVFPQALGSFWHWMLWPISEMQEVGNWEENHGPTWAYQMICLPFFAIAFLVAYYWIKIAFS